MPVTIEEVEKNIIEIAYQNGYVKPRLPLKRTGNKVAVFGSGPPGVAPPGCSVQRKPRFDKAVLIRHFDNIFFYFFYGYWQFIDSQNARTFARSWTNSARKFWKRIGSA